MQDSGIKSLSPCFVWGQYHPAIIHDGLPVLPEQFLALSQLAF
jgi:hypothetical protein